MSLKRRWQLCAGTLVRFVLDTANPLSRVVVSSMAQALCADMAVVCVRQGKDAGLNVAQVHISRQTRQVYNSPSHRLGSNLFLRCIQ